jgi:FtsP/CotA-like multicopper oxidase with cupredoxin domain
VTDEVERAMNGRHMKLTRWPAALAALLLPLVATGAGAEIQGTAVANGGTIALTAKETHITTGEGNTLLVWGLAQGAGTPQYPAPTLVLDQGATITIELSNALTIPVSLVFPGQLLVSAAGGVNTQDGLLTKEALPGGTVTYTLTASHAGTYAYYSGTRPELEVEMGLTGAILVRPSGFNPLAPTAYGHPDTAYDREFLFLLSDMDPIIHSTVEFSGLTALETPNDYFSKRFANYWFINGRTGPDTLLPGDDPLFPSQPYNCAPLMHPGERLLMRVVGAGRDSHPFHHHGNHARVIARNGRMLASGPATGPDLSVLVFTIPSVPGETADAIFEWTGKDLGWDIYGTPPEHVHTCSNPACPDSNQDGFDDGNPTTPCWDENRHEYCPDHNKPLPVSLPNALQTELGPYYSGSPFMGVTGFRPPGNTSFNPGGGFAYMFHSHVEKELVNFNIFPGGMMTMLIVEPLVPTP